MTIFYLDACLPTSVGTLNAAAGPQGRQVEGGRGGKRGGERERKREVERKRVRVRGKEGGESRGLVRRSGWWTKKIRKWL